MSGYPAKYTKAMGGGTHKKNTCAQSQNNNDYWHNTNNTVIELPNLGPMKISCTKSILFQSCSDGAVLPGVGALDGWSEKRMQS